MGVDPAALTFADLKVRSGRLPWRFVGGGDGSRASRSLASTKRTQRCAGGFCGHCATGIAPPDVGPGFKPVSSKTAPHRFIVDLQLNLPRPPRAELLHSILARANTPSPTASASACSALARANGAHCMCTLGVGVRLSSIASASLGVCARCEFRRRLRRSKQC